MERLPLYCSNCNKKYIKEGSYNKHKLLCCNNANMSPIPLPISNKIEDLSGSAAIKILRDQPTILQTVEALVKSNNILKMEIANLKSHVCTQKRKIPIIDILNKNFTPTEDYNKFLDIQTCRANLEYIFTTDLVSGILEILKTQLDLIEENGPLQAFDQKDNKIYGFNEDNQWELISIEKFDKILFRITKNILAEFKVWQEEHKKELYNEDFSTVYLKNVKKVMGGNMDRTTFNKKIYNYLYQCLKKTLTNIEYEIL